MPSLDGRVAVITGGARGQGEAEARLFAAEGARVVITDVIEDRGAAVAADIGPAARFVRQDVSLEADWNTVVAEALAAFGAIDILINNAAISGATKLEATLPDDYDRVYRVNQFGVYLGMRAVLDPMKAAGGGCIINISSVAGTKGTSTLFPYAASKWAVRGMTKAAALELARYKIRVNAIVPGIIETEMLRETPQRMSDVLLQSTPLRRRGMVEEIAGAALYLASPAAGFVTGVDLTVDGGMSL
jgi:3alpha(or 20beta)-hydroxysteroid dehydrogenase